MSQFGADGGSAVEAPLSRPEAVAFDVDLPPASGGTPPTNAFIADSGNDRVRQVHLATGLIDTVVEGLEHPSGLSFDETNQLLFVADRGAAQVYQVDLATGDRMALSPGGGLADWASPGDLVFYAFPGGDRFLFVLDAGEQSASTGGKTPPRLVARNLDAPQRSVVLAPDPPTTPVCTTQVPEVDYRFLYGIAARTRGDGGLRLFVAADVGEDFADVLTSPTPFGACDFLTEVLADGALGIELDLYDGIDNDGDGRVDFDDESAREPLFVKVIRFSLGPGFSGPGVFCVSELLSGFRKIQIDEGTEFPGCGGFTQLGMTPPSDLPDLVATDLAIAPRGIFVLNSNPSSEGVFYVDVAGGCSPGADPPVEGVVQITGAAGVLSTPFDGSTSPATRYDRPKWIYMDPLGNLILSDTNSNRVRRAWIGYLLPEF